MVSRSSVTEYRPMTNVTCELVWVRDLLIELDFAPECPIRLYCDNQVALYIPENSIVHECTKHIEVDYHLVNQKIKKKIIQARHISSEH